MDAIVIILILLNLGIICIGLKAWLGVMKRWKDWVSLTDEKDVNYKEKDQ